MRGREGEREEGSREGGGKATGRREGTTNHYKWRHGQNSQGISISTVFLLFGQDTSQAVHFKFTLHSDLNVEFSGSM